MDEQDKTNLLQLLEELKDACGDIRGIDGYYLDGRVIAIAGAVRKCETTESKQ